MELYAIVDENGKITHHEIHENCPSNGAVITEIPTQISAIKFLVQLEMEGVTEANILAIINTLPEPNKTTATVSFKRAAFFERDNLLLLLVGQAYGFNDAKLDEIFINADKLPI